MKPDLYKIVEEIKNEFEDVDGIIYALAEARIKLNECTAILNEANRVRALGPQIVDENFDWVEEANRRGNIVISLIAENEELKNKLNRGLK